MATPPTLALVPLSCVYELSGPGLKAVLAALGKSQADLTRACGWVSEGRVCRLVGAPTSRLSSKSAGRLIGGIRALGGDVSGLVPGVDVRKPAGVPA